jgi:hypothetical protein
MIWNQFQKAGQEDVGWIKLSQNTVQWRAFVNMLMKSRIKKLPEFLEQLN